MPSSIPPDIQRRIDALLAAGEPSQAEALAQQWRATVSHGGTAERAGTLSTLADVQTRQGHVHEAVCSAAEAVALTRRSRRPEQIALALLREATTGFQTDPAGAASQADEAAPCFEALCDAARQDEALRVLGAVRMAQRDLPEHRALLERAVALARLSDARADVRSAGRLTRVRHGLTIRRLRPGALEVLPS